MASLIAIAVGCYIGNDFTQVVENQGEDTKELSSRRRLLWLKNINRKDWSPAPVARVCSVHFITGKPAALFDHENPDWAPNVKMGYESKTPNVVRYQRTKRRRQYVDISSESDHLSPVSPPTPSTVSSQPVLESENQATEVSCQTDLNIASLEHDNQILIRGNVTETTHKYNYP